MTHEEIEDAYYQKMPIQFRWRNGDVNWKDCSPIYPSLNWERCEYRINPNAGPTITIPKPKFKVGDVVFPKGAKQAFQVDLRNYNLPFGNWAYYDTQTGVWWWEQELELVVKGVENV